MDWNLAIERNHAALGRIVAMLVAMAGLASLTSPLAGEDGSARRGEAEALAEPGEGCFSPAPTLPRHLHRAILRLLRPAESAVRRLVVVMARGLVVTLAPPRPRKARPAQPSCASPAAPAFISRRAPALQGPPPPCGEGLGVGVRPRARSPCRCSTRSGPFAPGRSGRSRTAFRASRFPASPRRFPSCRAARPRPTIRSTRPALRCASRRSVPHLTTCPDRPVASPVGGPRGDHKKKQDAGRTRRVWPLRPGRPPGQRPANRRTHEVHEILHDLHGLAFDVLEHPDTS